MLCTLRHPCRRATLDIFSHVLGMDLQFHLHRKTGEVQRWGWWRLGCGAVEGVRWGRGL